MDDRLTNDHHLRIHGENGDGNHNDGDDNLPTPPWFNELQQTGRLALLSIIVKNRSTDAITDAEVENGKLLKIHFNNGSENQSYRPTTSTTPTPTATHQPNNDDYIGSSNRSSTGSNESWSIETSIPVVIDDDGSMMIYRMIPTKHHPLQASSSSSSSLPGEPKNYVNHPNNDDDDEEEENVQIRTEQVFGQKDRLLPRKQEEEEKKSGNVAKKLFINPDMTTVVGHGLSSTNNNNSNNHQLRLVGGKNLEAKVEAKAEDIGGEVNSRHYRHYDHDDDDDDEQREQEQQQQQQEPQQPRNHHFTIETKLADKDSRQQERQQRRSPQQPKQQQQRQPQKPTTIYDNGNNPGNNNDNNVLDDYNDLLVSALELKRNYIHSVNIQHICQADHQRPQPTSSLFPKDNRFFFLDRSKNKNIVSNVGNHHYCCSTLNSNNYLDSHQIVNNFCQCCDIENYLKSDKFDGNQIQINDCFNGDNFNVKKQQRNQPQGSDYHWPPFLKTPNKEATQTKDLVGEPKSAKSLNCKSSSWSVAETNLKHPHQSDYIIQFVSFECGQCVCDKYCLNGSTQSSSSSSLNQQLNHLQQQQQRSLQNVDPVGSLESSSFKTTNFSIIKFELINNINNNNNCHNHHNDNNHHRASSIDGKTVFQDTIGHCDDDDDDGKHHWIQCDLNQVYERFIVATTTTTTTDANVGEEQLLPFVCNDCRRPVGLLATKNLIIPRVATTKAERQSTIINLCEKHCVHLLTLSIYDGVVGIVPSDSVIQEPSANYPKMVVQQTQHHHHHQPQPPHRHYLRNGNTATINRYNGRQTVSTTSLNTVATNGNHHHHHHHHKTTNQNGTGGAPFIPKRPSSVSSSNSNESNKDLSSSTDCSLDTDSSGDYEYGPGIVDRLRHKFMALSSKHHPTSSSTTAIATNGHYRFGQQKKCLSSVDVSTLIKRCSSMEELTFKQQLKQCGNNNQKLPLQHQHRTSTTKPSLYNGHQMVNGAKKKLIHHMSAGMATTNGYNGSAKKLPPLPPPPPPPLPKSLPPDDEDDDDHSGPKPQYPKGIVQKLIQQQQQQQPKQTPKVSITKTSVSATNNNDLTDPNTTFNTVATDLQWTTIQSTIATATSNNLIDQHPHHLRLDGCGESMMNGGRDDICGNGVVHPGDSGSLLKQPTTPQLNHNLVINKNSGSQNLILLAAPKPYMKRSKSVETLSLFSNAKFSTLNNCLATPSTSTTSNDDDGVVVALVPQSEQSETNTSKQEDFASKSNTTGPDPIAQQSLDIRLESERSESSLNTDQTSPSLMVHCDSLMVDAKVVHTETLADEDHNQCNNKCFNNNNTRDSHNDKSTLSHFEAEAEDTSAASNHKGSEEQQVALAVVHKDIVDDDEGNHNMEQQQQQEAKEDQHHSTTILSSNEEEEEPPTSPLIKTIELAEKELSQKVDLVQFANNDDTLNKDIDPPSSSSTPTATNLLSGYAVVNVIGKDRSLIDPKPRTKMIVTNELPKPDTVKTVKKIFESNTLTNGNGNETRKSSPDSGMSNFEPAKQPPQQQKLASKSKPTKSVVAADRPTHRYRSTTSTVPKSSTSSTTTGRRPPPPPPIPPPMASRLRGTLTKDQTESNNRTSGARNSRPPGSSTSLHSSQKHYAAPKPPLSNSVPKPEPVVGIEDEIKEKQAIDNNADINNVDNNETSGVQSSKITTNNNGGNDDDYDGGGVGLIVENVANNDKSFPLNGMSNKNDTDGGDCDNDDNDNDSSNNNAINDSKIDSNNMMILIKNTNHDPLMENVGQKPVCNLRTFNCSPTPSNKECQANNDYCHEPQQISLSKTTTATQPPTLSAVDSPPPSSLSTVLSLNANKPTANPPNSVMSLANTNKFPRTSSIKDSKKMNVKKKEEEVEEEPIKTLKPSILQPQQRSSNTKSTLWCDTNLKSSTPAMKSSKIGSTTLNGTSAGGGGGGSSIVFDFRDNKNVKPNIAIQPTPYGSKPIPKRIMKEIRSGTSESEDDYDYDDDDEDDDYDYGGIHEIPKLPCGIIFEGENIVINFGSLLHRRNKNLSIKFNDSGISIFEYPSELTDDDEDDNGGDDIDSDDEQTIAKSDNPAQKVEQPSPSSSQNSVSNLVNSIAATFGSSSSSSTSSTSPSSSSSSSPVVINGHATNVLNKKSFATGSSNLASYKPSKVVESRFELGVTKTKNDFQKKTDPMNNHHHHHHHHHHQPQQQHQNHQQQPNRFVTSKQSDDEDCDNATMMMNTMIKPASVEDTVTFSQSSTASDLLF